jgi:hypothetical protein
MVCSIPIRVEDRSDKCRSTEIPTFAPCSFDEIVGAAIPGQPQFLLLYVIKDRERTRKVIQHAEKRVTKGLFITVDAPLGRREKVCGIPGCVNTPT